MHCYTTSISYTIKIFEYTINQSLYSYPIHIYDIVKTVQLDSLPISVLYVEAHGRAEYTIIMW